MRKIVILLISALFLAACSTPKYTYYFDYYDYNAGKKVKTIQEKQVAQETTLDHDKEIARSNQDVVHTAETSPAPAISKEEAVTKFNSLSKEEKKEVKKELKKYIKENKSVLEAQRSGLSGDLKLAVIFGVVGIVLMIVLGDLFWLGTIAILIGLFFLVRYLINS